MWHGQRVCIVFPAYNEAAGIAEAVHDFALDGIVDEVIVIDNNSRDGTGDLARNAGATVLLETKQGYGNALRRGLAEANADLIIMAEPDSTFAGKDVLKLLAYSDEFDLVLGTRTTRELIWHEANMGWFLRFGNIVVAKMIQWMFDGPSLSDCGCTLRLVRRPALDRFQDRLTVGASHFLPEMVILALLQGLKVIEIPVNYRGRRGVSKITGSFTKTIKVGLAMIGLAFGYRARAFVDPSLSVRRRRTGPATPVVP